MLSATLPSMSENTKRPTALITGASSGIGLAFAELLASRGFDLILVARRKDRLDAIAARLRAEQSSRVLVIAADLGEANAPEQLVAQVMAARIHIDVLINNAGYALKGAFLDAPLNLHTQWLNVMVNAPVQLTRLLLPAMIERGRGRIVNVASIAAWAPDPTGSLYNAAKAFMIGETRALARDLKGTGITVTAVCPGFTESEFHDVAGTRGFVARLPSMFWMDARECALIGWRAAERGSVICVTGAVNVALVALARVVPHVLIDWFAPKRLFDSLRLGSPPTTPR
ncbi:MAG: SDR family oxidoreductase [Phycisphaerales bacterium]|nr:SDR family oxidoreductase [Phycisphaerales bacterium]